MTLDDDECDQAVADRRALEHALNVTTEERDELSLIARSIAALGEDHWAVTLSTTMGGSPIPGELGSCRFCGAEGGVETRLGGPRKGAAFLNLSHRSLCAYGQARAWVSAHPVEDAPLGELGFTGEGT